MSKLTTTNLTSLQNEVAATNNINNNFAAVTVAVENTLSRDGTSPNSMGASLDMNSNRILNLVEAVSDEEPVRKAEFDDLVDDVNATLGAAVADATLESAVNAAATAADRVQTGNDVIAANASAAAALVSENNAAATYDAFDDRYLGSKSSDPTLDNDGNALLTGALYWSTTGTALKVYTGSAWVSYTGSTGIASVQADTTPKLGGNLDINSHNITGTGNINITGSFTGTASSSIGTSAAFTTGTIELGAASDTTLSRASAGRLAVEGVNVVTISSTDTLTNKTLTSPTLTTPVLGTPSSGTLTSCTGLPVAGITSSTSTALGVGSLELGNATDTTLSRFAAGVLAVEGGAVYPGVPQTSKSAAYTVVLADANTHILHPTADNNARTFTIDSNANVAFPIGTTLTFINKINTVTIAITSDTLTLAAAGTTGSRTLAANGIATATKITSTEWIISGVGLT